MKHRHGNSVASLQCELANKLIIHIAMHKKSTHLQVNPKQSARTQQIYAYRHTRKTSGLFYGTARWPALDPAKNLLTLVYWQKSPFLYDL